MRAIITEREVWKRPQAWIGYIINDFVVERSIRQLDIYGSTVQRNFFFIRELNRISALACN